MPDSKAERIAELLASGLDLYGMGEVEKAARSWRAVLALDPTNALARDYLDTADGADLPPTGFATLCDPSAPVEDVLEEAGRQIREGGWEEALEFLYCGLRAHPESLPLEARVELVRGLLLARYRDRIGSAARPQRAVPAGDLSGFELPSEAGFLLSMIDGSTAVEDLISLSGMDAFHALRLLLLLVEAGAVELAS